MTKVCIKYSGTQPLEVGGVTFTPGDNFLAADDVRLMNDLGLFSGLRHLLKFSLIAGSEG